MNLSFLAALPFLFRERSSMPAPRTEMPVVANGHPTPMTSPRKPVAPMPVVRAQVAVIDAVRFFVEDWVDVCGVTVTPFEQLLHAYEDLREERDCFPEISPKKFSQTLTALGCPRFVDDRRKGKNRVGKRVVVFEMNMPRREMRREAA
jgi:hypothetical protein